MDELDFKAAKESKANRVNKECKVQSVFREAADRRVMMDFVGLLEKKETRAILVINFKYFIKTGCANYKILF